MPTSTMQLLKERQHVTALQLPPDDRAMSLTHVLLTRHQSRENEQMHTALDSMAQGLCMFDGSERLVACNSQYYKMYGLTSADVTPGTTLSEVLAKRVAKGTFNRDPHQYRKDFLTAVALGIVDFEPVPYKTNV